jgi:Family of unknown function (DUF6519)
MDGDFKSDFARDTFDPIRHFTRVLMQQGRVQLDADWNEQTDLFLYALRTVITDMVGRRWGSFDFDIDPALNEGAGGIKQNSIQPNSFKIGQVKDSHGRISIDFSIGDGHYYVDGILCENPSPINYTQQQPAPTQQLEDGQQYWVYLDVWEQQITSLEDSDIREIALGENGPDTATRAEVVWQVKVSNDPHIPVPDDIFDRFGPNGKDAGHPFLLIKLIEDTTQALEDLLQPQLRGEIKARSTIPTDEDGNPCITPPDSRFRGEENQLYRVEVHTGGTVDGGASFKWSRENGSAVFPITGKPTADNQKGTTTIPVGNLGRDDRFTLEPGDWVELVDDDYVLQVATSQSPINPLLQVDSVDRMNLQVTLKGTLAGAPFPGTGQDQSKHPLLRRWDQKSGTGKSGSPPQLDGSGTISIVEDPSEDGWITLEDGVQIQFQPGGASASPVDDMTHYRTGDYWLIPARTIIGDILWPQEIDPSTGQSYLSDHPQALPPHGVRHHYALLAAVSFAGNQLPPIDLRYMVPPLAKLLLSSDIALFRAAGL